MHHHLLTLSLALQSVNAAPTLLRHAAQTFRNSEVSITNDFLKELLVGSVADAAGVSNGSSWIRTWLTEQSTAGERQQRQNILMQWGTPSMAFRQLPDELKLHFDKIVAKACSRFCVRHSKNCCSPQERCHRLGQEVQKVYDSASVRFHQHWHEYQALSGNIIKAAWPFAQGALLPYFISAGKIVEDLVWFSTFLWSLRGSNPTLLPCLESNWAKVVRGQHLTMLDLWRDLHRFEELLAWELVATSQYSTHRWIHLDDNLWHLEDGFQKMSNVVLTTQKAFKYIGLMEREQGSAWMTLPDPDENPTLSLDNGEFGTLTLRRQVFAGGNQYLDKPVLRFLLRNVFVTGETVADFGAMTGQYAAWLNDTGLVEAFAFDGTPNAAHITGGVVHTLDLTKPAALERAFDWILCLEVGEHLPKQFESVLMDNIARHARKGAIMSWATPDYPDVSHVNTLPEEESTRFIELFGFKQDRFLTEGLRQTAEVEWLKQTIGVYLKEL